MKSLVVNKKYDNKKLNAFLLDTFKDLSMNTLYKALRKKDIRINDKRVSENVIIHEGDTITIYISDDLLCPNNNENMKKEILSNIVFEDNNILIVNKPSDLETVSNKNNETTLTTILKSYNNNLEPCHRLDRNTIGLVIFAKNKEALKILFDKFKTREITKIYQCVVYGLLKNKERTIESYLFKDEKKSKVYIIDEPKEKYQKIITSYKVLKEDNKKNISLLEVTLHTGKTHQIRAHLAHIGHPILGDGKYGKNEINKEFKLKTQLLCACKIKFEFTTESGILSYLNNQTFTINPNFKI